MNYNAGKTQNIGQLGLPMGRDHWNTNVRERQFRNERGLQISIGGTITADGTEHKVLGFLQHQFPDGQAVTYAVVKGDPIALDDIESSNTSAVSQFSHTTSPGKNDLIGHAQSSAGNSWRGVASYFS